tara:strand:- start:917 stop:1243 length:327 start_codon:yes stop_codon:yes gene_type:complete
MQNTRFADINQKFNNIFFGFLKSSWKSKSTNIISIFLGYFLFANFITKFISEGKNELVMVPIIILIIELIIRLKPTSKSNLYSFWSIVDNVRIGATYALILEAFKLGS